MDGRCARSSRLPHVPALNGLRGLAVAAVLLFHAGVGWLPGGQLGVTVFFTLSGFLITALLLAEKQATGAVALRAFWGRRARRLVPAMLVCFGLIAVVVRLSDAPPADGISRDAIAAATWTANWRFVAHHATYADLFSMPSPFQHFWSLSVEEQFYVVFPLLLVVLIGRRGHLHRGRVAAVLAALIVLSTVQAARLYDAGAALGHAYYGTDARMAEILVGALLALGLLGPSGLRVFGPSRRVALDVLAAAALAVIAVMAATVHTGSAVLYRGGFLSAAVCTAVVLAAVVQPGSTVARVLSVRPLAGLGVISYGVYMFHWPLFLALTAPATGLTGLPLLAVRVGATLALSAASYAAIEAPIRRGALRSPEGLIAWGAGATAGVAAVVLAAGILIPTGPDPELTALPGPTTASNPNTAKSPSTSRAPQTALRQSAVRGATRTAPSASVTHPTPRRVTPSADHRAQSPAGIVASPTRASHTTSGGRRQVPTLLVQDPNSFPLRPVPDRKPGALKVAVVGDSVGYNLGEAMRRWAVNRDDVVVYDLAVPACPLSRGTDRRVGTSESKRFDVQPVCGWWDDPTSARYQAFQTFDPDVVVAEDGINETWDRRLPSWEDWRGPADPRFDAWVTAEYQTAVDGWRAEDRRVVMLNTPCVDWRNYPNFSEMTNPDQRVTALNSVVYPAVVGVTVADLFSRVCPDGQFTPYVEGFSDSRPDGFHFTDDAALALATDWLGPLVLVASGEHP
jgi:peptidoglycan/LPS O-acetylase OafA/YrhL